MKSLQEFKKDAEQALQYVVSHHRDELSKEPINWADLSVVNVEYATVYESESRTYFTYRAYIEEAAPECEKFNRLMVALLKPKYADELAGVWVDVSTEW